MWKIIIMAIHVANSTRAKKNILALVVAKRCIELVDTLK